MANRMSAIQMLAEGDAARIIGVKTSTLRSWRARLSGPAFHKMPGLRGAVRYDIRDIEAFLLECRQTPSVRAFVKEQLSGCL